MSLRRCEIFHTLYSHNKFYVSLVRLMLLSFNWHVTLKIFSEKEETFIKRWLFSLLKRDIILYVVWKGLLHAILVSLKPKMCNMISETNFSTFKSVMLLLNNTKAIKIHFRPFISIPYKKQNKTKKTIVLGFSFFE